MGNQANAAHTAEEYKDEAIYPVRECQSLPLQMTRRQYTQLVVGDIKRIRGDNQFKSAT